ncbi:phage tail tape measure protein [Dysgonomonas termitidis]|uniref:Phage tail tape measure protein n=1 Tax=Dysgonomonas termitidis TaxID=1516126 RepID=A0ABV9KTM2_9BACT
MDLKATADSIRDLTNQFEEAMQPGMGFEVQMKNVQSITRQTDAEMERLGDSARQLAKDFGGDASAQLESFGSIIAQFGPAVAKDNDALASMGHDVSTLSKLMQNDAVGAMDALTTSMLQFGVDLTNPKQAAAEMTRMMNVMAAAGNEGASEVADTSEALKNSGIAAKNANLSFEETNAALQALAQAGSKGSEAGVGLRNVLGKMGGIDIIPRKAQEKLKQLGVDYDIVSDKTLPFATRLRELKKAQGDATLIAQIFGIENEKSAMALLNSIDAQEEMTQAITGTNAASESAAIVMDSQTESISRMTAWVNDLKIGLFNAIGGITPFVIGLGTIAFTIANVAAAATGISKLITFVKSLTIATHLQTAAQWLLNAAFWANPVVWIVAGIAALIATIVVCWNKFEGFRKVVMGVWEVVKGFGGILKDFVIDRIKGIISGLGAMGEAIYKLFTGDFSGAWESAKQGARDLSGYDAAMKAKESFSNMSISGLYDEGAAKGAASWAESQKDKETDKVAGPLEMFQTGGQQGAPPAGTGDGLATGGKKKGGKGSKDGVTLGGSGSGGGKSIVMNITNNFTGFRGTREMAEEVCKVINNKLSDSLAIVS